MVARPAANEAAKRKLRTSPLPRFLNHLDAALEHALHAIEQVRGDQRFEVAPESLDAVLRHIDQILMFAGAWRVDVYLVSAIRRPSASEPDRKMT
jgi:hypothetical protein